MSEPEARIPKPEARIALFDYSFVTVTNVSWPSRRTRRNAVPPDGIRASSRCASAAVSTGCRPTRTITSPGCMPARAAGLPCSTSVTTAPRAILHAQLARDLRRDVLQRDAEAAARFLRRIVRLTSVAARGVGLGLEVELVDRDVERPLHPVAHDAHRNRGAGPGVDDHANELVACLTGLPLKPMITSPGSRPALLAALSGDDALHDRALAILQAELVDRLARNRADRHADAAARDLAGAQLRQQLAHGVDGNREADADVALLSGRR